MAERWVWTAGLVALALASAAHGQSSNAPPVGQPSPAKGQQAVTVTAKALDYKRLIDRRSYSLANDIAAANGSLADALRNIPSLEVDPDGTLSLRGDTNVTILIDGQKSALFNGPNRAQALRSLPANGYARVEVMTSPSAAYGPEGTGGIINLISKTTPRETRSGEIGATADSFGGYRATLSESYAGGKLTLSGEGSLGLYRRHPQTDATAEIVDPASGETAKTADHFRDREAGAYGFVQASATYDLDKRTRLGAELAFGGLESWSDDASIHTSSALAGVLARDFAGRDRTHAASSFVSSDASIMRQLGGDGHEVSLHASLNYQGATTTDRQTFALLLPTPSNLFERRVADTPQTIDSLKAEYKAPLGGQAKLDAGYEFQFDEDTLTNRALLGTDAADAAPQPAMTDRFRFRQAVNALFVTYERPFGRLDIMPGLRLEDTLVDTRDVTTGRALRTSLLALYPTLHLTYKLDDNWAPSEAGRRRRRSTSPAPARRRRIPTEVASRRAFLLPNC